MLFIFGTLFYNNIEGWSYVDSFYFTGITLTTIGYGDLVPTTNLSKIITVFFSIFGIGIFLYTLTAIAGSYLQKEHKEFIKESIKRDIAGKKLIKPKDLKILTED